MKKNKAGSISAAQAVEGMQASLRNAEALLEEAQVLSNAGHPARAVALAILAYEELGKLAKLANVNHYAQSGRMGAWWKAFRSHNYKIASQDLLTLCIILEKMDQSLIEPVVVGDTAKFLNRIKMKAIYTDLQDNSFVCPLDDAEVIGREKAVIDYVQTTLQLHRAIVATLTPEFLADFWRDRTRQDKVDDDVRAFRGDVARRWVSDRFAPPDIPSGPAGSNPA